MSFKVNDAVIVDRGPHLDAQICRIIAVTELGCPVCMIRRYPRAVPTIIPLDQAHRIGHYVKRWWGWHLVHLDEELNEPSTLRCAS